MTFKLKMTVLGDTPLPLVFDQRAFAWRLPRDRGGSPSCPAFAEESHRSNRGYLNLRNQLAKEPLGPQGKLTVIFKKWDDILFCLIKVDGSEALL